MGVLSRVLPRVARTSGARHKVRRRASLWTSVGLVLALFVALAAAFALREGEDAQASLDLDIDIRLDIAQRRLQENSLYPDDPVIETPYRDASNKYMCWIHVILIGYMLLGLNTVCDVYFTGALDVMVERWQVKPDVAGATFMAAGGSAPELFTSLVGTCIAINDVGFGTIVGSAVFNVLFVIGLCGFAAATPIKLTWWPLFRDCTFYILGLSLLAVCASDQKIELYEAIILFSGYLCYCVLMYNNDKLEKFTDIEYKNAVARFSQQADTKSADTEAPANAKAVGKDVRSDQVAPMPEIDDENSEHVGAGAPVAPQPEPVDCTGDTPQLQGNSLSIVPQASPSIPRHQKPRASHIHGKMHGIVFVGHMAAKRHDERMQELGIPSNTAHDREAEHAVTHLGSTGAAGPASKIPTEAPPPLDSGSAGSGEPQEIEEVPQEPEAEEEEEEPGLMDVPEDMKDRILWYLSLPIYVPLYYLTPEPEDENRPELWFLLTFAVSLMWIAGFSFFMVWWFEIIGEILRIPTIVMGLTVIAAGTSIPDAVSSVAVARMGEGDMAVSSSIGSNIFDILVGLPIPWIVKIGFIELGDFTIGLKSDYLTFYVLLLLFMVMMVVVCIHLMGWKLNRALGCAMAGLYAIFLVIALLVEGIKPDALKF